MDHSRPTKVVIVSDPDMARMTCELCQSDFPATVVERTTPDLLADPSEPHTICPACRVIYNFEPDDDCCIECGSPLDAQSRDYRFDLEFPVSEPGESVASLSGRLCGDCAAHIGLDLLFNGINSRPQIHDRLLRALTDGDTPAMRSLESSDTEYLSGGPLQ